MRTGCRTSQAGSAAGPGWSQPATPAGECSGDQEPEAGPGAVQTGELEGLLQSANLERDEARLRSALQNFGVSSPPALAPDQGRVQVQGLLPGLEQCRCCCCSLPAQQSGGCVVKGAELARHVTRPCRAHSKQSPAGQGQAVAVASGPLCSGGCSWARC